MVSSHQVCCVHMVGINPLVVTLWESFPLDEVLQLLRTPGVPVGKYPFDLLLFFSIDQVRRGPGEVWPMSQRFFVRRKERSMKHIVYPPIIRQC